MKNWLLDYICCPNCHSDLELTQFDKGSNNHVKEGILICNNKSCKSWYPIYKSIPRLLTFDLREQLTQDFYNHNKNNFEKINITHNNDLLSSDKLIDLKKQTIRNFGFEWTEYSRFGWDDEKYNIDFEKKVFEKKSLMTKSDLAKGVVLDAGCGNGRYAHLASQSAKKVIGMDLGDAVDAALANTKESPNIGIIQGDIFQPPFREETFDAIYSIGVLMHTGNAKKATDSLNRTLRKKGKITIHLYGKGNFIYEYIDKTIRQRTVKYSIPKLQKFTDRMFLLFKFFKFFRLHKILIWFIRVDPHPHCIFDWYSAPIATHHTYSEVRPWFEEFDLNIIASNEEKNRSFFKKILLRISAPTVTIKGEKL